MYFIGERGLLNGGRKMFRWKDYEENTCLFIDGIDTNVAVLRYKDHQLTDSITGIKKKINAISIDDAKKASEKILLEYWKKVKSEVDNVMDVISK